MQQYRIYEVTNKHIPIDRNIIFKLFIFVLICWPFAKIWRKGLVCLGLDANSYFGKKKRLNGDSLLKYKQTNNVIVEQYVGIAILNPQKDQQQ